MLPVYSGATFLFAGTNCTKKNMMIAKLKYVLINY